MQNDAEIFYNLAYGYLTLNNFELAILDFDKVIELEPDFVDAFIGRGGANYELKNFDLAIADFNKAVKLNQNAIVAYYLRGLCYQALSKFEQAEEDFTIARQFGYNC